MKIRILDRILVALAGLLMLASGAALAAQLFFGKDVIGYAARLLGNQDARIFVIIGGVLVCLLGLYCLLMLFRHRGKDGKFITQKTDTGELSISLKALESMVQKCLEPHKEISTQSIHLENQKGSLLIRIRGTVAGGISIPLTVDTLQQQIKQYVTACSGVEVKGIKVMIESSGADAKDAPFAIAAPQSPALLKGSEEAPVEPAAPETGGLPGNGIPAAAAQEDTNEPEKAAADSAAAAAAAAAVLMNEVQNEPDDRPVHQRLFSNVEEPCVMPMPPTPEEKEEDAKAEETVPQADGAPEETDARPAEETDARPAEETESNRADEPKKADAADENPETEGSVD